MALNPTLEATYDLEQLQPNTVDSNGNEKIGGTSPPNIISTDDILSTQVHGATIEVNKNNFLFVQL